MTREKLTLTAFLTFAAIIAVFLLVGPMAGLRFAGLVGVIGCVKLLRARRVGVGIDGYEPAFYLTGWPAMIVTALAMVVFLVMIAAPQTFAVMVS